MLKTFQSKARSAAVLSLIASTSCSSGGESTDTTEARAVSAEDPHWLLSVAVTDRPDVEFFAEYVHAHPDCHDSLFWVHRLDGDANRVGRIAIGPWIEGALPLLRRLDVGPSTPVEVGTMRVLNDSLILNAWGGLEVNVSTTVKPAKPQVTGGLGYTAELLRALMSDHTITVPRR